MLKVDLLSLSCKMACVKVQLSKQKSTLKDTLCTLQYKRGHFWIWVYFKSHVKEKSTATTPALSKNVLIRAILRLYSNHLRLLKLYWMTSLTANSMEFLKKITPSKDSLFAHRFSIVNLFNATLLPSSSYLTAIVSISPARDRQTARIRMTSALPPSLSQARREKLNIDSVMKSNMPIGN